MAETFAERLNAELKKRKMSGRLLADTMNINKMTVVRWRRGIHEPRQANVKAVAVTLGVPVSALLDDREANSPEAIPATRPPSSNNESQDQAAVLVERFAALDFQPTVDSLRNVVPDLMQVLGEAQEYARRRRGE